MTGNEKKQLNKMFHGWTAYVYSINMKKVPGYAVEESSITQEQFEKASELPYCITNDGCIVINEAFPDWEGCRNLFVALDALPHSLLEDICRMEEERYGNMENNSDMLEIEDQGEKVRRMMYHFSFMTNLIKAHKENSKKHY